MKKLMLSLAVVAMAFGANAQISFGGLAGANFASTKTTFTGTPSSSQTYKDKVGLTIGAIAEIGLGNGLSLRPELNFIQKGGKISKYETINVFGATLSTNYTESIALGYLELAPNLVYNLKAGSGKFFVGVGPDLAFGLGGKYKFNSLITSTAAGSSSISDYENKKIKFDGKKATDLAEADDDYHLKALDFGINVLAGYKMRDGAFISAGYTTGLSNFDPNDQQTAKNSGFNIKIGFLIDGKSSKK